MKRRTTTRAPSAPLTTGNRPIVSTPAILFLIVLIVGVSVVHDPGGTSALLAQTSKGKAAVKPDPSAKSAPRRPLTADDLPRPVAEMRETMLAAAQTGNIAEMKMALELNEMKPELAETNVPDPIAFWKKKSADGEGREILAILWTLLDSSFAAVPLGRDLENNKIYVWPALAEKPFDQWTARDHVELLRLVSPAEAGQMQANKRYTGWRLAIGADGTWHSFKTVDGR